MLQYFHILGLAPQATLREIKTAYRKLAFIYHPDKNPDNEQTAQRFREITEAYQHLSAWKEQQIATSSHAKNENSKNKNDYYVPHYQAHNLKYKQKPTDQELEYQQKLQQLQKRNLYYKGRYLTNSICPYCKTTSIKKVFSHTELHGISYVPLFLGVCHCDSCGADFYARNKKRVSEIYLQSVSMITGLLIAVVLYLFLLLHLDSIIPK
jgi:hypothetical protein